MIYILRRKYGRKGKEFCVDKDLENIEIVNYRGFFRNR